MGVTKKRKKTKKQNKEDEDVSSLFINFVLKSDSEILENSLIKYYFCCSTLIKITLFYFTINFPVEHSSGPSEYHR